MQMPVATASMMGVLVVAGSAWFGLVYAHLRVRGGRFRELLGAEKALLFLLVCCAFYLMCHLTFHRYFLQCHAPQCTSRATGWLVAYGAALLLQPAPALVRRRPLGKRDWLAGAGAFLIAVVAGKAACVYGYRWGREWVFQ